MIRAIAMTTYIPLGIIITDRIGEITIIIPVIGKMITVIGVVATTMDIEL